MGPQLKTEQNAGYGGLSSHLRDLLLEVVGGSPSNSSISALCRRCQALASAFLFSLLRKGSLRLSECGISPRDVAIDCIADLFAMDENGHLVQIERYFAGIDISTSSTEELLGHLRRLVFSSVNRGLFRIYNEIDPVAGKILRNVKLALQAPALFKIVEHVGEPWIVPTAVETLEHLPAYSDEELARDLSLATRGKVSTPELLASLSLILRSQNIRRRSVRLMSVVHAIRRLLATPQPPLDALNAAEANLVQDDALAIIKRACEKVKEKKRDRYFLGKLIKADIFDTYFSIIESRMIAELLESDKEGKSYYASLRCLHPGLQRDEYNRIHKSIIEYLGRLVREEVIAAAKKAWGPRNSGKRTGGKAYYLKHTANSKKRHLDSAGDI
jgi:hypothetical protein